MFRYIATAAVAGLVIAVAVRSRSEAEPLQVDLDQTVIDAQPAIQVIDVPGGKDLTIRHRFAGSVSRARLVYEKDGDRTTVDQTNCQRSLDPSVKADGYSTEVKLSGRIPADIRQVHVVLEDETGTRVLPLDLN